MVVRRVERPAAFEKYRELLCTARGSAFPPRGEALLYPAFRSVRIKAVKSAGQERYLVTVKGAPRRALKEGAILVAVRGGLYRDRVGYGLLSARLPPGRYSLRGGLFRGCELPGSLQLHPSGRVCRFVASGDLPLVPGGRYQILSPGEERRPAQEQPSERARQAANERGAEAGRGLEAPGGGRSKGARSVHGAELLLVIPGEVEGALRGRLLRSLEQLPFDVDRTAIYGLILSYRGWVECAADFNGRSGLGGLELSDTIVVSKGFLAHISKRMVRIVRGQGGAAPREVANVLGVPEELVVAVGEELLRQGSLRKGEGLLLPPEGELPLSPYERSLYESLRRAELAGRPAESLRGSQERELFAKLKRLRLVEELAGAWVVSDVIERAGGALLEGRKVGSSLKLDAVRELLGVGRREALGLLERLEAAGEVERAGEEWRVLGVPAGRGEEG